VKVIDTRLRPYILMWSSNHSPEKKSQHSEKSDQNAPSVQRVDFPVLLLHFNIEINSLFKKKHRIILCFSWRCKTNTLPILMHQMRISTTQVSSVMLRSQKLEIRKKNVKTERAVG
jgi:hypothetical protein